MEKGCGIATSILYALVILLCDQFASTMHSYFKINIIKGKVVYKIYFNYKLKYIFDGETRKLWQIHGHLSYSLIKCFQVSL